MGYLKGTHKIPRHWHLTPPDPTTTDTNTKEEQSKVVPESVNDDLINAPASPKTLPHEVLEEDKEVTSKTVINKEKIKEGE